MHILYVHTHEGCVCTDVLLCVGDSCVSVSTMHCTCCVLLCVCVSSLQSVSVLPLKAYSEFQSYLTKEYSHLVSVLEPSVSARWKVRGRRTSVCVCVCVCVCVYV